MKVELGSPYKLEDTVKTDDVKAVTAHPQKNGTAFTLATCQNREDGYHCESIHADMNYVKIDNCLMTVQPSTDASGTRRFNATLKIDRASTEQPRHMCFVYEFMRNGRPTRQSTLFTVSFTAAGEQCAVLVLSRKYILPTNSRGKCIDVMSENWWCNHF